MNGNSDQIRSKFSTKIVNTMLAIILVLGLSPLSKASASVVDDSSQAGAAEAAQQSSDDGSEGADVSTQVGADTGADSSNVVAASGAAAVTPNNQSAENVTGGGASGVVAAGNAVAATALQPTNHPAVQNGNSNNAVAVQAETYNPDAEPRKVTQGLTVGVYKDKDCNESLGNDPVSTDTLLYGKVNIDFSSEEAPSLASPNICYEFPKDQIDVPNQEKATLYDGTGAIAGSWYIENGVAHLKYNEDWLRAHQSGIIAHFNFEFTLGLKDQGDGKSETIVFPGTTTSTTVNTKDGDVSGDKFGKITNQWNHEGQPSFDSSDNSYTWTVKVSPSSYATDLVIEDKIGQNLDFVEGSFSLVDASGNPVPGKCDASINGKSASISLGNLPKGDYYVQYKTVVGSDALKALANGQQLSGIDNTASWKWGSKSQNVSNEVKKDAGPVNYKMVSKSASGDAGDIVWTVKLNTGNLKADMSSYKFADVLGEGHSFKEGSQYEVKDASGNVVASGKVDPDSGELNFTLPDNIGKQELTVTYHTVMDDASSKVSNEAKVTPPANSIYPEGMGNAEFGPVDDETYITKELVDASTASIDGYATWKSVVNFTKLSEDTDPSSIVFFDKIEKTKWTQHMTFDQVKISIEGDAGVDLVEGVDYSITKDGQYGELEIAFKSTALVKSLLGSNGHNAVVSYRTHSDASNDVYTNTSVLHINGQEKGRASASYTSKKSDVPPVAKKSNSIWWDADYDWKDGSAKGAWIASWSVSVNKTTIGYNSTAALDLKGQPIVVTDTMDEGMVYVDGSAQYDLISSDSSNLSKRQQKPEVNIADGKTVFTIPADQAKTDTGATNVYAELSYNTAIKPSLIGSGEKKDFSNAAEAKSGETEFPEGDASASVTNKVLDKISQRASDNSHVTYTIKVNEHAQDLVADSDMLTLVDEMSSTCSFTNGSLRVMSGAADITSSVKYTLENATGKNGLPITKLTLIVPDSTALTITYDVSPQGAVGDVVTIDNTVSLEGSSSAFSHDGKPWKVQNSNAGTEAQSFGVSIKKTDETGNNPLKGAKFSLFKVDLDASSAGNIVASPVEENKETNDAGVVEFGSQESPLNANILYYCIETQAPDGYEITNTDPAYVLFSGVSSQDKADYVKVLAKARALGIEPGQGTSYNVYNKKSETPAPKGSAILSLKKMVNGEAPTSNQSFEFKLSAATEDTPMPAESGDVVSTSGSDAEKSFGEISFDAPGTYKYKIEETSTVPSDGNVWSMAAPVYAQVEVGSAVDGKLPTSVKYYSDEGCTQELSDDKAVFNNAYVIPASVSLAAKKIFEGGTLEDGQFSFKLKQTFAPEGVDLIEDRLVANDAAGDISFGEISYEKAGTYEYEISEVVPENRANDIAYDETKHTATVKVEEGEGGQLAASLTYDGDQRDTPTFTNKKQAPTECVASINITKTVNGSTKLKASEGFSFQLFGADEQGKAIGGQIGKTVSVKPGQKASFDAITFDKEGTYNYVIHEVKRDDGGWIAHADVPVSVTVTKDATENKLNAVVNYGEGKDAVVFDNTYQASGSAVLSVVKKVNGKELKTDRSFSFGLTPVNGAPMPEGKDKLEVSTTGSEASSFGSLQFSLADAGKTYKYRIHETTAASDGWTMAGDVFALVTVGSDQGGGKLGNATVKYVKADDEQEPAATDEGSVVFDNQYSASTSAEIKMSKAVEGGTEAVKGEEFTFELHKANNDGSMSNDVIGAATAKAGETASFGGLTYKTADAGKTFTYWIVETGHDGDGWAKPGAVKAIVKVIENDDLSLSTQVSYGDRGTDAARFTNKYTTSGDLSLSVYKTVNGGTSDKPGEKFSFQLFSADGDGNAQGNAIGSLETEMGKKTDFSNLRVTKEGTYHYVIKEAGHNGNGWTAAPDVKVKVVAKDNGKGALSFDVEYSNANAGKDAALFDNKYKQASGEFQLGLVKTVNGNAPAADQSFKFKATSTDEGAPELGEVATDETGKATFAFDGLNDSFEGEEFTYTISEEFQDGNGWTKAADVKAKVAVGQRGTDNKFHPTVTYQQAGSDEWVPGAAKFNNRYEQPKQPGEGTPKGETPQQPDSNTPSDQPKPSADGSAPSSVKTGDSLALVGGGVALVAVVAAAAAWFAFRRKRG